MRIQRYELETMNSGALMEPDPAGHWVKVEQAEILIAALNDAAARGLGSEWLEKWLNAADRET